ncbi:hypothetical protein [Streptomyces sp. NPDC094466]|uniref:hypothetical protein n=1 Tax=Streptomyces sp. NPDC094466 TaxID=3366065 RepID=UPI00381CB0D2
MSDEQITYMARSLDAMASSVHDAPDDSESVYDGMFEGLAADVRSLAERDPERVKGLVNALAHSEKSADRELAVTTAESLIDYDYLFAREALLYLYLDPMGHEDTGGVWDAAVDVLHRLGQEKLTPEQYADFNARLDFMGHSEI